jgi:glycosyltransferase involved in cell wall biosynthesis
MNDRSGTPGIVALVAGEFVPTGGMDMPNLALASYLARNGREVVVVAHRIDKELAAHTNVSFRRVPKPLNSYFLGAPFLDLAGRRVGRRVLARGGRVIANGVNCSIPDLNWVHYVHAAYSGGGSLGIRAGRRLIERPLVLRGEKRLLRRAEVVIANSARTRADLIDKVGVRPERVVVVYYGIDQRFRPAVEEDRSVLRAELGLRNVPTLVFVGALGDRRKGFDTLLDAWRELGTEWDASLLVIGRGAELARWKERTIRAGLAGSVTFTGFRDDVPRIMRAADCIVAPTRYEAFGQAVHEALSCGLPAIVSAQAGVVERMEGNPQLSTLLLDDPESPSEIRTRLMKWRSNIDFYHQSAIRLSDDLRQRTWDVMSSEIAALLNRFA